MRRARGRPCGRKRNHGLWRSLQKSLDAMRDGVLQGGKRRQLNGPTDGGTQHETCGTPKAERAHRLRANVGASLSGNTVQDNGGHGAEEQETTGGRGPRAPGRN